MRAERYKTILYGFAAFAALCVVSLYRQLSRRYMPRDIFRPIIVYIVYLILLGCYMYSVRRRFTSHSMRHLLYEEIMIMAAWLSVRFLQDFVLYKNVYLMRVSGYLMVIPVVFIPLLGFYAALGFGKGENYRRNRRWMLLLIPAALLTVLTLTNEHHFLVFRLLSEDEGVNLYFHPNFGVVLIALWAMTLEVFRIIIIFRQGYRNKSRPYFRFVPFGIALLLPAYAIPYFASSFFVTRELMELSAALFFLEAMLWESCVLTDMIPINTRYQEAFRHSTMGMQIFTPEGETIVRSTDAMQIPPERLQELKLDGKLETADGLELNLHPIHDGLLVWQRDMSRIYLTISQLQAATKELRKESRLLQEALRIKSEETKTQAQNQIYDRLTREVGGQLALMDALLKNKEGLSEDTLLRRLCVIGMFVKRRCNLRLTEQETGTITGEDILLSLTDMTGVLLSAGILADIQWQSLAVSPEFFLFAFDVLEYLLEYENFSLHAVDIRLKDTGEIQLRLRTDAPGSSPPADGPASLNRQNVGLSWQILPDGYQLTLTERSGENGETREKNHKGDS